MEKKKSPVGKTQVFEGEALGKDPYLALGASADKRALHELLKDCGCSDDSGFFARLSEDLAGDPSYYSFIHSDGCGTKSIVAYLLYRETGDESYFAGLAQDALVMNLDDVFCVGEPQSLLFSNAIARNASLVEEPPLAAIVREYCRLTELFKSLGIPLSMSGGETADCADTVRTLMVDLTLCGRIPKARTINTGNVKSGDLIVGLSSTGRAGYENENNSGISSNGLTLARHVLLRRSYARKYPEVSDPNIAEELSYRGPYGLLDEVEELGTTVGKALLSPTRSYAPILAQIYRELAENGKLGDSIHAVINVTGGGQAKILNFGRDKLYVKDDLFPPPPLFELIQREGQIDWRQMYRVFNMGHRVEICAREDCLERIVSIANSFGVEAKRIGYVKDSPTRGQNRVEVQTPKGSYEYTR